MLRKKIIQTKKLSGKYQIGIVAAQYNLPLVDSLLSYTVKALNQAGIHRIHITRTPGSYEIPVIIMTLAQSHKYDVIIALGVILQGKTSHANHIALASAIHLQQIAIETGVPVIHQILTPKNIRDALKRLRIRGVEAARAAIQMAEIMRCLK